MTGLHHRMREIEHSFNQSWWYYFNFWRSEVARLWKRPYSVVPEFSTFIVSTWPTFAQHCKGYYGWIFTFRSYYSLNHSIHNYLYPTYISWYSITSFISFHILNVQDRLPELPYLLYIYIYISGYTALFSYPKSIVSPIIFTIMATQSAKPMFPRHATLQFYNYPQAANGFTANVVAWEQGLYQLHQLILWIFTEYLVIYIEIKKMCQMTTEAACTYDMVNLTSSSTYPFQIQAIQIARSHLPAS